MTHFTTLVALGEALQKEIPIFAVFTSVNTRLIIQTGVNLKSVRPEQNEDPETIEAVQTALQRMGFLLEEGRHHA